MDNVYQNKYSFNYLLSKFLTSYCMEKRNLSSNTIHSYATNFKLFIQYCINDQKMKLENINFDVIDEKLIEEYLDKRGKVEGEFEMFEYMNQIATIPDNEFLKVLCVLCKKYPGTKQGTYKEPRYGEVICASNKHEERNKEYILKKFI